MDFFVRIKLNDIFRSIKITTEDLKLSKEEQIQIVIEKALEAHAVQSNETLSISLIDQFKMPIDDLNVDIISQFKGCSHFFIEILLDYQISDVNILIESFENFLKLNDGEPILKEHKRLNRLKVKTEKKLVQKMVDFTFNNFTMYPTETQVVLVCKAVLELFSGIKGGINGLYDAKSRRGAFFYAIQNNRRKFKQTAETSIFADDVIELSDEEKNDANTFLKTCILPRDKDILKAKLIELKSYRNELIVQSFAVYKTIWNFYFVCPDLILFDFKVMFENIGTQKFILKWPEVRGTPFIDYNIRIDDRKFPVTKKNDDIYDFLTYFKLIPTPRASFDAAVNSFMVYSDDPNKDPVELIDKNNTSPYLIIIASQETNGIKYYIDLEKRLMSLPAEYTFVQVVDFYIKLHKLFRLPYHSKIKNLMFFIEYYVYEIDGAKSFLAKKYQDIGLSIFKVNDVEEIEET